MEEPTSTDDDDVRWWRVGAVTALLTFLVLLALSAGHSRGMLDAKPQMTSRSGSASEMSRWALTHAKYESHAKITYKNVTYKLQELPRLVCNEILFVTPAHNVHDRLLDEFRQAWADKQDKTCFFQIDIHLHNVVIPPESAHLWKKRTDNPPLALVHRYRAALYLMSVVRVGLLRTDTGEAPWIMYVDSDTMMANVGISINDIVTRNLQAGLQKTVEEDLCSTAVLSCPRGAKDPSSAYTVETPDLILTVSSLMRGGYFTESGVLLFRPTTLNGFLFQVLASSPLEVIDVKNYKMGDQAIWDWMFELLFNVDWSRFQELASDDDRHGKVMRPACEGKQLVLRRDFHPERLATHTLLTKMYNFWTASNTLDFGGSVAWACSRCFNAASCPYRRRDDQPFSYRCGDFLWHLYGCPKDSWRQGSLLEVLKTPECQEVLPKALPPPL